MMAGSGDSGLGIRNGGFRESRYRCFLLSPRPPGGVLRWCYQSQITNPKSHEVSRRSRNPGHRR
ncbi:hypothetical protein XAP6164_1510007 [Xanthomonas phaseoli pv. phaseoli]|nr:hypothetical protein XAP6164_1510007 [Xanthomonas phaseoli pv. phaseoli]